MDKSTRRLRRQHRQFVAVKISRLIYKGIDGFHASSDYRKQILNSSERESLTYGEIEPKSFLQILLWIEHNDPATTSTFTASNECTKRNRVFVDLGCGIGRACICAALSVGEMFTHVQGYDIVPGLIDRANFVLENLLQSIRDTEFKSPTSSTKAGKKKEEKFLTAIDDSVVIQTAFEILSGGESGVMSSDTLANAICLRLGHKLFKQIIKRYKSFISIIRSRSDVFLVSEDAKAIQLVNLAATLIVDNGSIQRDEVTCNLTKTNESHTCDTSINALENILRHCEYRKAALPLPDIGYHVCDIFETAWWNDCYICYVASLLFSDDMMEKLTNHVMFMGSGSWVISLKRLVLDSLERQTRIILRHESFFDMSWDMANVYIYQVT